jgi:hypothetical protein
MVLSRYWGYKLKECGVLKSMVLYFFKIIFVACGCFSVVNS